MQFKNNFIIFILIALIAIVLGTKLLNKNNIKNNNNNKIRTSVFAAENYRLTESKKLDDLLDQKILDSKKKILTNVKSN
jgi:hypothetical protein